MNKNAFIKHYLKRVSCLMLALLLAGSGLFTGERKESAYAQTMEVTSAQMTESACSDACYTSDRILVCANMKKCYRYFHEKLGYNLAVTCAILANIQVESDYIPTCDDKGYYGLVQWSPSRTKNLKSYCSKHGYNYKTVAAQLRFINYESTTTVYPGYLAGLRTDVENSELGAVYAAWLWAFYYEGCATYVMQCRQTLARMYWDYFTSKDYVKNEVTVSSTGLSFPDKVGTADSWNFSGKVQCSETIDRLEIGIAYYTNYSGNTQAQRKVHIGSYVDSPKLIVKKPGKKSCNMSKITDTWQFAGLDPGTYTFYVAAFAGGNGYTVYEKTFKVVKATVVDASVPDAPDVSTSPGIGQVKVTWSRVNGAQSYIIYRKTGSGSYKKLKRVTDGSRSYTDKTVKNQKTYTYAVCAVCKSGTTGKGTARRTYYDAPALTVTNTRAGIKISWKKTAGASGYILYRHAEGGTYRVLKKFTDADTLSYVDEQVVADNGAMYFYAVRATDGTFRSAYDGQAFYRVTNPDTVKAKNVSKRSMQIRWAKNPHAAGYQIEYAKDNAFTKGKTKVNVTSGSTLRKLCSSLSRKKTYYVRVRAFIRLDGHRCYSCFSRIAKVTIKI